VVPEEALAGVDDIGVERIEGQCVKRLAASAREHLHEVRPAVSGSVDPCQRGYQDGLVVVHALRRRQEDLADVVAPSLGSWRPVVPAIRRSKQPRHIGSDVDLVGVVGIDSHVREVPPTANPTVLQTVA